MIAPTRVTRGSPCCAHCAPFGSASWRMLRNLSTLKTLPPRPTRACLYSAGARQPSSSLMAKTVSSMAGAAATSTPRLASTSSAREENSRIGSRRNPCPNISQLGFSKSTRTRPVSRSRKSEDLGNLDARQPAVQQLRERKAAAPVVHGHYDLGDAEAAAEIRQPPLGVEHPLRGNGTWLARRLHEACQREAGPVGRAAQLGNRGRGGPGTVDEDASLEDLLVGDAGKRPGARPSHRTTPAARRGPRHRAPGAGSARHTRAPQSRMTTRPAPPPRAPECRSTARVGASYTGRTPSRQPNDDDAEGCAARPEGAAYCCSSSR